MLGIAHDFFATQPIKDADIFVLRGIINDWGTSSAIKILRRLREAAVAGKTKLILIEQIAQYASKYSGIASDIVRPHAPPVPEFLLPNVSSNSRKRKSSF